MVDSTSRFVGLTRQLPDMLDPWAAKALAATLDTSQADSGALPVLWHWVYFRDAARRSDLGSDGHPAGSSFLPPGLPPRRMFAGAEIDFLRPLQIGHPAVKIETIEDITEKSGSSGRLVFLRYAIRYEQDGEMCISERRTIVYREPGKPGDASAPPQVDPTPVPAGQDVSIDATVDPATLFRYSALTFNAHRIHYDLPYATGEEGYPGLVVHGPLLATMLADAAQKALGRPLGSFRFRALAPVFGHQTFHIRGSVVGGGATLQAYRPDGKVAVDAVAEA